MKKLLLVMVFSFFLLNFSYSQTDYYKTRIGVRAGVNASTVGGSDNDDNYTSSIGYYAGFLSEFPVANNFTFQIEAYYSTQGFKFEPVNTVEMKFNLGYIQVPVLAKIYIVKGFNLHAGPQIGYKITENVEFDSEDIQFDTDTINDLNLAVVGGAEYKFPKGFFFQARFSYGIMEIIENSDLKNMVISAGVGFRL